MNGRLAEVKEYLTSTKMKEKETTHKRGHPMIQTARAIMCLPQGGQALALSYLSQKTELPEKDRAMQQASLENWFLITEETEKH